MTARRNWIGAGLLLLWVGGFLILGSYESRPLALGLSFLKNLTPDLLAALGTVSGLWALGGPLRRWIVPGVGHDDTGTRTLLEIGLGLSLAVLITSLLGSVGLLLSPLCKGLFVLGIIAALLRAHNEDTLASLQEGCWKSWGPFLLAFGFLFPVLFEVAAPLIGPDEAQYHRRFIEEILRTGSVPGDGQDPVSGFALGLHCITSIPASITGIGAMRPFSFLLGVLGLLGGERLLRRACGPGAVWAYVLVAVSSVSLMKALPHFNTDLSLSLPVVLIAIVALDWAQSPSSPGGRPWAMAIAGGAALSVKFTAPLFVAPFYLVVAIAILWDRRVERRGALLLRLSVAALLPLVFALPWLIKNYLLAGHPLYPIGGMSFPPVAPTAFNFNFDDKFGPGQSVAALLHAPWDLFITGREYDPRHFMGRFGVWPLVAIPGVLFLARKSRVVTLLSLAVIAAFFLWAGMLMRAVYLLPLWPVLAALTAGGLTALLPGQTGRPRAAATAILILALGGSAAAELAPAWAAQLEGLDVVTGEEQEEEYLLRHRPAADALEWIRRNSSPDEAVAQFWCWGWWDLPNRLVWTGGETYTPLRARLLELGSSKEVLTELHQLNVRWVLYSQPNFIRAAFPSVTDDDWQVGFVGAAAVADELVRDELILRHRTGLFRVYEVPAPD